jgi:xanthine dehydrogenase/oxidase
MEHVAHALQLPSIQVKKANFLKNGDSLIYGFPIKDCTIIPITEQLLESASFTDRQVAVQEFNAANRWRKRGICVMPMRFPGDWTGGHFNCLVSIFHFGGTIAVTHGGVELGQGINTMVTK